MAALQSESLSCVILQKITFWLVYLGTAGIKCAVLSGLTGWGDDRKVGSPQGPHPRSLVKELGRKGRRLIVSHLTSKAEISQSCIRGKKEQKHSVKTIERWMEGGEITEGRDLALARRGTRHRCEMRRAHLWSCWQNGFGWVWGGWADKRRARGWIHKAVVEGKKKLITWQDKLFQSMCVLRWFVYADMLTLSSRVKFATCGDKSEMMRWAAWCFCVCVCVCGYVKCL